MWAAIRSDLEEFVTTVKDESANVSSALIPEQTESSASREPGDAAASSATEQEESAPTSASSQPMIMVGDDGDVVYDSVDAGMAAEEVERLMMEEETFTEPLDEEDSDVKAFLESFLVEEKTDEISQLLEENPDTLKAQFEALVPTEVQYKDFWQRFYFRCDEDRILRDWEAEQEAARQARAEAIAGGIKSVKNLLGGAVKAVSSTFEHHEQQRSSSGTTYPYMLEQPQNNSASGQGGGMGIFGGHRPPFVLNTAVDEDDDAEEEDEEEEELGWDDDDSFEEEDEEAENEQNESEEVVEFSAENRDQLENLKEQLAQALEEREQLHKTVEMQTQEIASLRLSDMPGEANSDVEKLKMALFEKDSELAALRASLEDTHDEDTEISTKKDAAKLASQEREIQRLSDVLVSKDKELEACKEQILEQEELNAKLTSKEEQIDRLSDVVASKDKELETLKMQMLKEKEDALKLCKEQMEMEIAELQSKLTESGRLENADATKAALSEAEASRTELGMQVKSLKEMLAASQAEVESLRVSLESSKRDAASQDLQSKEETEAVLSKMESLQAELEESKGNLEFTTRRADHLEKEVQKAKEEMQEKEAAFESKLAAEIARVHAEHETASSDTLSTGVKVPVQAAAPPPMSPLAADDESDGWGDDWGDDD